MSDPLRTTPISDSKTPPADGDAERDAKIESLLLTGLDHYFAASYAQAIDVWTRALFLDRNHARARAYIDRARSAMAEEQRQSDELLHSGIAAFERGDIDAARQLLNAAVDRGAAHDVALAFLTRIDRIHAAAPAARTMAAAAVRTSAVPAAGAPQAARRWWPAALAVALVVVSGAGAIAWRDQLRELLPVTSGASEDGLLPARPVEAPIVVPRSAEMALERARALVASGRLNDALRAVDLVRPTDPLRPDADRLKAAIQRQLIAHHAPQ